MNVGRRVRALERRTATDLPVGSAAWLSRQEMLQSERKCDQFRRASWKLTACLWTVSGHPERAAACERAVTDPGTALDGVAEYRAAYEALPEEGRMWYQRSLAIGQEAAQRAASTASCDTGGG